MSGFISLQSFSQSISGRVAEIETRSRVRPRGCNGRLDDRICGVCLLVMHMHYPGAPRSQPAGVT
jgi:hypothetical protein